MKTFSDKDSFDDAEIMWLTPQQLDKLRLDNEVKQQAKCQRWKDPNGTSQLIEKYKNRPIKEKYGRRY